MNDTSQTDRVKALLANYVTHADYRAALVRDEDLDAEAIEKERHAAHVLTEMGPVALRALKNLLHSGDPTTRERAARALGDFGAAADEAVPVLMAALSDDCEAIRNAAVSALGKLGRCAVPSLTAAWRDRTSNTRWLAARALTLAGPWAEGAAPVLTEVLIEKLKHGDIDGANVCAALKSMGQVGARAAVPGLLAAEAAMVESRSWARHLLGIALRELAPLVVPDLVAAFRSGGRALRRRAAELLAEANHATEALPALVEALSDPDVELRCLATRALAGVGPAAVPALLDVLGRTESHTLQTEAVEVLGKIGPAAAPAVPALTQLLLHPPDDHTLYFVIHTLGKIGPAAAAAVPALITALQDRRLRWHAAHALEQIGPAARAAVPALCDYLDDEDEQVRRFTALAVAVLGPPPEAAPALVRRLTKKILGEWEKIAAALKQLGQVGLSALTAAFRSGSERFRSDLVSWLADFGPSAVPVLLEGLKDEKLAAWAACSLEKMGPEANATDRLAITRPLKSSPSDV
jgi:HEAT repeat protein